MKSVFDFKRESPNRKRRSSSGLPHWFPMFHRTRCFGSASQFVAIASAFEESFNSVSFLFRIETRFQAILLPPLSIAAPPPPLAFLRALGFPQALGPPKSIFIS